MTWKWCGDRGALYCSGTSPPKADGVSLDTCKEGHHCPSDAQGACDDVHIRETHTQAGRADDGAEGFGDPVSTDDAGAAAIVQCREEGIGQGVVVTKVRHLAM